MKRNYEKPMAVRRMSIATCLICSSSSEAANRPADYGTNVKVDALQTYSGDCLSRSRGSLSF